MINVDAALLAEFARRHVSITGYGEGIDLLLDDELYDGENLVIHVTELGDGIYCLSDSGQLAASLFVRGVDLSKSPGSKSWQYIRTLLTHKFTALRPPDYEPDEWALEVVVGTDELREGIRELAAAMLRADGLGNLGKPMKIRGVFASEMAEATARQGLVVEHDVRIDTRSKMARKVQFTASTSRQLFEVQTLTNEGGNLIQAVDRSYSILADSTRNLRQRVAVFDRGADRTEFVAHLSEVAVIVRRDELPDFWRDRIAA